MRELNLKKGLKLSHILNNVFTVSRQIEDKRTLNDVLTSLVSEVGELAEEIKIESGRSYKSPGRDGIKGEVIDCINCLVDILYVHDRKMTALEFDSIMSAKLTKWLDKSTQTRNAKDRPFEFEQPSTGFGTPYMGDIFMDIFGMKRVEEKPKLCSIPGCGRYVDNEGSMCLSCTKFLEEDD